MDAVNLLLRTVGFELTRELMHISTTSVMMAKGGEKEEEENEDTKSMSKALDCIVDVMAPWHCIMTMTSGGRICISDSAADAFDEEEATSAAAVAAFEDEMMQARGFLDLYLSLSHCPLILHHVI